MPGAICPHRLRRFPNRCRHACCDTCFLIVVTRADPVTRQLRSAIVTICLLWGLAAQAAEPLHWIRDSRPTSQAQETRRVLDDAQRYGLSPDSYRSRLSDAQLQLVDDGAADAELLHRYDEDLSALAARFVNHLRRGRVDPRAAGFDLPARVASPALDVKHLADSKNVDATLASLEPTLVPYRMLKEALVRYRQLAHDGAIDPLPPLPGRTVRLGEPYPGAALLRRQLGLLGDLQAGDSSNDGAVLDGALVAGLKRFQGRHGLQADGALGAQTHAALNVSMQRRVRQIELSLERWRWLSALPRPDIVINIPQFMLYALPRPTRPGEPLLEIPVIVGKSQQSTPVFTASIEQVIFNPYWNVPSSILRNELLPKIRKDVSYLERYHFEIVRGPGDDAIVQRPTAANIDALATGQLRLRQRPGPDNALGPVKFVLPNPYSIRLHGTSEPGLFDFTQRALSHGCIRVSDPAALAEYVLANARDDWNSAAVEAALCGTRPRRIVLETPVRVLVFYATAAATASRGVLFAPDVYGLDARLERLLASSPRS